MRKTLTVLVVVLLVPLALVAQSSKADVFGGYSYLRNSGNSFNGWEGQVTGYLSPNFGITGDVSGHYNNQSISLPGLFNASANQHIYTFLFGPTIQSNAGKHDFFGHALFGGARQGLSGSVSIPIGGVPGLSTGDTAFAMALGGGVDLGISDRFAFRPAQVDYLYTRFGSGHQNSFRYSAGIVIRF